MKIGVQKRVRAILASASFYRPKKVKPRRNSVTLKSSSHSSKSSKIAPKEEHLQFFLTEFESGDHNDGNNLSNTGGGGSSVGSEDRNTDDSDDEGD